MFVSLFVIIAVLFAIAKASEQYSFVAIGDWGGAYLGGQYLYNTYNVSNQMATTASQVNAKFVINTGDNYYWCGVQNSTDPQFKVDFELPYAQESLQVPWYSSLGNHEYGYNVDAQIQYMKLNPIWYLPARYYTKRIQMQDDNYMTLIVLDSNPCVAEFRSFDSYYWDPCGSEYPTCSLDSTDDDFEGPCEFHTNILSQNCNTQYNWLQNTLAGVPKDDWLVIVAHHPLDEINVKDFTTLLQNHGFGIYLNGHQHILNQYTIDGVGAYVTTGSGSMVSVASGVELESSHDQVHPITRIKLAGGDVTPEDYRNHHRRLSDVDVDSLATHTYHTVYKQTIAGFTLHQFSTDFANLTTTYISFSGDVLHTFVVAKDGTLLS